MPRWLQLFRRKPGRRRVLFVCLGNSCRSQMAEAFARAYGRDVLVAHSAGLLPSHMISPLSRKVMKEKGIPIRNRAPRLLGSYDVSQFDLVVNLSGQSLCHKITGKVVDWAVDDPGGQNTDSHREVRDRIETLVTNLLANLRFRPAFAPLRDPVLRSRAAGAVLLALLAACTAPAWSTPLYDHPADYTGQRYAGPGGGLIVLGHSHRNVSLTWEIQTIEAGLFRYSYTFHGFGPSTLGMFLLELDETCLEAAGCFEDLEPRRRSSPSTRGPSHRISAAEFSFLWITGIGPHERSVEFISTSPPVWGDFFALSHGRVLVFNAGWTSPGSSSPLDFIARPGLAERTETPELPTGASLLLALGLGAILTFFRRP